MICLELSVSMSGGWIRGGDDPRSFSRDRVSSRRVNAARTTVFRSVDDAIVGAGRWKTGSKRGGASEKWRGA